MIRSAAYEKLSGNAVKLLVLMQTHWRMYEPYSLQRNRGSEAHRLLPWQCSRSF
jgi:hypothetical protein